jgi:hypothetical protein
MLCGGLSAVRAKKQATSKPTQRNKRGRMKGGRQEGREGGGEGGGPASHGPPWDLLLACTAGTAISSARWAHAVVPPSLPPRPQRDILRRPRTRATAGGGGREEAVEKERQGSEKHGTGRALGLGKPRIDRKSRRTPEGGPVARRLRVREQGIDLVTCTNVFVAHPLFPFFPCFWPVPPPSLPPPSPLPPPSLPPSHQGSNKDWHSQSRESRWAGWR